MSNKRMKIENLENLQELTTEEFSSVQGGLSIKAQEIKVDIASDHVDSDSKPLLVDWDPKPLPYDCHPKPIPCHYPIKWKHPIKKHDIIHIGSWCPVRL